MRAEFGNHWQNNRVLYTGGPSVDASQSKQSCQWRSKNAVNYIFLHFVILLFSDEKNKLFNDLRF